MLGRGRPDAATEATRQIAVAPDYVLVFKDVARPFLEHLKETLVQFYGEDPQQSPDYGRIVNVGHFETRSGDAAINDCTVQPVIHDLPFGGVGNSGMGKYHGEWGFRAYTNARGVLNHSTWLNLGFRYPPYDRYRVLREIAVPS